MKIGRLGRKLGLLDCLWRLELAGGGSRRERVKLGDVHLGEGCDCQLWKGGGLIRTRDVWCTAGRVNGRLRLRVDGVQVGSSRRLILYLWLGPRAACLRRPGIAEHGLLRWGSGCGHVSRHVERAFSPAGPNPRSYAARSCRLMGCSRVEAVEAVRGEWTKATALGAGYLGMLCGCTTGSAV